MIRTQDVRRAVQAAGDEFTRRDIAAALGVKWPSEIKEAMKRLKRSGEIVVIRRSTKQGRAYFYRRADGR